MMEKRNDRKANKTISIIPLLHHALDLLVLVCSIHKSFHWRFAVNRKPEYKMEINVNNLKPTQSAVNPVHDFFALNFKNAEVTEFNTGYETEKPELNLHYQRFLVELDLDPGQNFPAIVKELNEKLVVGNVSFMIKNRKGKKIYKYPH